jgi:hypothetical protein
MRCQALLHPRDNVRKILLQNMQAHRFAIFVALDVMNRGKAGRGDKNKKSRAEWQEWKPDSLGSWVIFIGFLQSL